MIIWFIGVVIVLIIKFIKQNAERMITIRAIPDNLTEHLTFIMLCMFVYGVTK